MERLLIAALLLAPLSCGGGEGITDEAPAAPARLVFLEIRGLHGDPGLPSGFSEAGPVRLEGSRLAEDLSTSPIDISATLAAAFAASDMLVMFVDCPVPADIRQGRDNISISTGTGMDPASAVPLPDPPDLLAGIGTEGWSSLVSRQDVIREIYLRFAPDIVMIRCSTSNADTAIVLGAKWLESVSSGGGNLLILSPPEDWYRGWVVMAGSGIDTIPPEGLTPAGVVNTAALLAGIPPVVPLSSGVPAIGTLVEGGKILP
ncbi:MAG: hypothetical protein QUS11_05690 [Candidatus Fermentibacter sp.]|nr:hypothetical protein [Candidatus Fermentibacter sp.]